MVDASCGLLDRDTPVASIGSCFARQIKDHLVARGFNYVQAATGPNARHGSAAWDRVYNTACLRQEFERALGSFEPAEASWRLPDGTLLDPYRKNVTWTSVEHAETELAEHRAAARKALTRAEILIATIGLTEVWYSRVDGSVFFQVPPSEIYDDARHAFRNTDVDENRANLERCHELLRRHNPGCKMIVTVSPVPLRATFEDRNVVVSNAHSKATLLAAAHAFAAGKPDVFYFPSYELVTHVIPDAFGADNRHVRPEAVAGIMEVFEATYM